MRFLIQVESLYRIQVLPTTEPPELLILDEVESVLEQFGSGLHKRFSATFAVFQWMVSRATCVICLDANLGERTHAVMSKLRSQHPVHYHWNQHQPASNDVVLFARSLSDWLSYLYKALTARMRVEVPSNSLENTEVLGSQISSIFPHLRVKIYSSKTPDNKSHFGDMHSNWGELDVLIYTPVISAGISYELDTFDIIFGYFTAFSCGVESCRQMQRRVRSIRSRQYCLFLSGGRNIYLPTTVEKIERQLVRSRELLHATDGVPLHLEYGCDGVLHVYKTPALLRLVNGEPPMQVRGADGLGGLPAASALRGRSRKGLALDKERPRAAAESRGRRAGGRPRAHHGRGAGPEAPAPGAGAGGPQRVHGLPKVPPAAPLRVGKGNHRPICV